MGICIYIYTHILSYIYTRIICIQYIYMYTHDGIHWDLTNDMIWHRGGFIAEYPFFPGKAKGEK